MSRLTKKCGDWGYTVPGLNSVVKDNAEIIGEMTNKLAEYENLGSVEDLKGIHQANQRCEKILETSLMVSQNNRLLSHELEVYQRALKNEIPSNYYELEKVENEEQYIDLRLDQARKELEDESRK